MDGRESAQRDHERYGIKEVAVAVLEPAATVIEESRDEDRDRRAEEPPGAWLAPVGLTRKEESRARDQDGHPESIGLEERERRDRLREVEQEEVDVHRDVREREQPERPLRFQEGWKRRQAIAGFQRRSEPDLVVREERDDRGQDAETEQGPPAQPRRCGD